MLFCINLYVYNRKLYTLTTNIMLSLLDYSQLYNVYIVGDNKLLGSQKRTKINYSHNIHQYVHLTYIFRYNNFNTILKKIINTAKYNINVYDIQNKYNSTIYRVCNECMQVINIIDRYIIGHSVIK